VDEEGEWTEVYNGLFGTDPRAADLGLLFKDGHTLLEAPTVFPGKEDGGPTDLQELLDATSQLCGDLCQHLGVVSSWTLDVPVEARPKAAKTTKSKEAVPAGPSKEWYAEFAQRMIASVQEASRGWFFASWSPASSDESDEKSLEACLEKGWVDLSNEVQIMQPTGGSHKASLVYLHGYTCDGYSYLLEPEHFYKPKAKKKKKGKTDKKKKKGADAEDEEEDDEQEYEPIPGLKVLLPSAPERKITANKGEEIPSWYDYITDYEGEQEDELAQEDLEEVTRRMHALLDAEAALVGGKNVFVGGASQGCGVALHVALTYPGELGGVVGTMGHVLTCSPVTKEWAAKKIPVFAYNGLADETIQWEKWAAATWKRLQDVGADVRIVTEEGVDHAEREDTWLRAFLAEALRPASVKSVAKKKAGKR